MSKEDKREKRHAPHVPKIGHAQRPLFAVRDVHKLRPNKKGQHKHFPQNSGLIPQSFTRILIQFPPPLSSVLEDPASVDYRFRVSLHEWFDVTPQTDDVKSSCRGRVLSPSA